MGRFTGGGVGSSDFLSAKADQFFRSSSTPKSARKSSIDVQGTPGQPRNSGPLSDVTQRGRDVAEVVRIPPKSSKKERKEKDFFDEIDQNGDGFISREASVTHHLTHTI